MDAAKWVTETAIKRRSFWILVVPLVVMLALTWSMDAYLDSVAIVGGFSGHPQSPYNGYAGSLELWSSRWFWWRFLTITGVEYNDGYYRETGAWVVHPGYRSRIGVVFASDLAEYFQDVQVSPAAGYQMQAPKVEVVIRFERYHECKEDLDNTEVPVTITFHTKLLWLSRTVSSTEKLRASNMILK